MGNPAADQDIAGALLQNQRVALRESFPLQRRKIFKKCIWGILAVLIGWSLITAIAIFSIDSQRWLPQSLMDSRRLVWLGWIGILAVLLFWRSAYQIFYFASYFYDMDDENFVIRKGVVAKREINLPFSKITDVYVDQDVLDVLFGLYDVHISTPTTSSGQFAHIDGLNRKGAMELKKLILDRINREGREQKRRS